MKKDTKTSKSPPPLPTETSERMVVSPLMVQEGEELVEGLEILQGVEVVSEFELAERIRREQEAVIREELRKEITSQILKENELADSIEIIEEGNPQYTEAINDRNPHEIPVNDKIKPLIAQKLEIEQQLNEEVQALAAIELDADDLFEVEIDLVEELPPVPQTPSKTAPPPIPETESPPEPPSSEPQPRALSLKEKLRIRRETRSHRAASLEELPSLPVAEPIAPGAPEDTAQEPPEVLVEPSAAASTSTPETQTASAAPSAKPKISIPEPDPLPPVRKKHKNTTKSSVHAENGVVQPQAREPRSQSRDHSSDKVKKGKKTLLHAPQTAPTQVAVAVATRQEPGHGEASQPKAKKKNKKTLLHITEPPIAAEPSPKAVETDPHDPPSVGQEDAQAAKKPHSGKDHGESAKKKDKKTLLYVPKTTQASHEPTLSGETPPPASKKKHRQPLARVPEEALAEIELPPEVLAGDPRDISSDADLEPDLPMPQETASPTTSVDAVPQRAPASDEIQAVPRSPSRELIELQKIKEKAHSASRQLKALTKELEILKARQHELAASTGPYRVLPDAPTPEQSPAQPPVPSQVALPHPLWAELSQCDPAFSLIVLREFLASLYISAQRARRGGGAGFAALAPYIVTSAQRSLFRRARRQFESADTRFTIKKVHPVAVESLLLGEPSMDDGIVTVSATFVAHYRETYQDLPEAHTFTVLERWNLKRGVDVPSRQPEQANDLSCPACREPVDTANPIKCGHCSSLFGLGTDDWTVTGITVLKETRWTQDALRDTEAPPPEGTPERREDFDTSWEAFWRSQRDTTPREFNQQATRLFSALAKAINEERIAHVWPMLTDLLVDNLGFWFDAYSRQGLRRVVTGAGVDMIVPEEVFSDSYFDAITVHIYLFHHEYTVDRGSGEPAGNTDFKTALKRYSQRWTLIRPRTGDPTKLANCYECGQEINQAVEMFKCPTCHAFLQKERDSWLLHAVTRPLPES